MSNFKEIATLFALLFICTLDGYSMMNYRLSAKKSYGCFAVVAVICLAVNSYIAIRYGSAVLRNVIIFTIGFPYFALILLITDNKISQTVFNFWLWINVYEIITNFSMFVNDCTFANDTFLALMRLALLGGYFALYNLCLRTPHRQLMEMPNVNWWFFSFIPLFFTALLTLVNYNFDGSGRFARNYPILLTVHILMIFVYLLIFYTLKTVYDAMEKEHFARSMKEQIALQKKQYEFYLEKMQSERIFRHDARHRDTILLGYFDRGDVSGAKKFLSAEMGRISHSSDAVFCGNVAVNSVLSQYSSKAENRKISFVVRADVPQNLSCDEAEFCVMLSNLLENSLDAAKDGISVEIRCHNRQISIKIENDYDGEIKKDTAGGYLTTKPGGTGLGLKSVAAIIKENNGFLEISDAGEKFIVFATLKN